jgi:Cu/Ag efflux protein CusF
MKRSSLTSLFALAISLAFVSGVMAQQKPAPAQTAPAEAAKLEKYNGVIEKVDGATKDLLVQFHKEKMTFSLGDHTKIMEGKKELSFTDLKKGMWASVEYKKEGNKLMAGLISVGTSKGPAKKEARAEMKKENPSEKQSVEKK